MTADLAGWALDYARGGAAVLPLHTPTGDGRCTCRRADCVDHIGKHPRTAHGLTDASSDPQQVRTWWAMWPAANIGIRPASGLIVIDVDPRAGGDAQLAAMQRRFAPLPTTRTAFTGGGGVHIWLACPDEVKGKLAPGIEVKTHANGYVVAPPSLHRSGAAYTWVNTGPVAEAPEYLRALLRRPPPLNRPGTGRATPAMVAGLIRRVGEAERGERNAILYWACCRAYEHGIEIGALIDAAVANGLSQREAEATANSAANAPARAGGGR